MKLWIENLSIVFLISLFYLFAEYPESKINGPNVRCKDVWIPVKKIVSVKHIGGGDYRVLAAVERDRPVIGGNEITFSYGPPLRGDKPRFTLQQDGRVLMEVYRDNKLKISTIGGLNDCVQ